MSKRGHPSLPGLGGEARRYLLEQRRTRARALLAEGLPLVVISERVGLPSEALTALAREWRASGGEVEQ